MQAKAEEDLSDAERVVLSVEALEREVNNGGYELFFKNSSRHFARHIVASLKMINCPKAAAVTIDALAVVGTNPDLKILPSSFPDEIKKKLQECDERFFKNDELLSAALFAFVAKHHQQIKIP